MALEAMREDPGVDVIGLLTAVTADYDRVSIHGIRRSILHAQAAATGLPLIEAELAAGGDNAAYERAWASGLQRAGERLGAIDEIAYGDLFLRDVRAFREELAQRLGVGSRFPLWGADTGELARRCIARGYEAYLCCVDTTLAPAALAGRRYDAELLAALPSTVDPCGERGEFHTCVAAGPVFRSALRIVAGERVLRDGRFEYCDFALAGDGDTYGGDPT
jgi:uncharacterized protein (TIGR00290 family)